MMLRRGSTLAYASLRRATLATSSGASTGVAVGHSGHLSAEEAARRSELRNVHDGPAAETVMSHKEKYLFDLTGFLVVKDVLTAEQLKLANAAIDSMELEQSPEYFGDSEALKGANRSTRLGNTTGLMELD